ncbi:MAG: Predicted nucleic acid-binding protein, contains PIN domain [Candidatus Kentron sp. G]|nr:MAG: Predicted nucleic acid-binding protein, contains PIN domain [Candidatus Kentron sp. G]VFM95992.1 MAG: Predicted nucleic acid-binding protein, contains PIN domain [Candidatus Kentron sp. G]VFM97827.1 MAG: Predicted nucleic acid-binding protein, contains PIN domain [Candidatus Kentron sp. G]
MVMMDDKALFVDTNVLVYANVIETPMHERALAAINAAHQADRTLWISRQIIREYLVAMTRPQAFKNLPKATVLEQVDQFIERFQVANDTAAVTGRLAGLMRDFRIGGRQVHDANIVATMLAHGIPALLTHNTKDFERFRNVIRIEGIDSD